MITVTTRCEKYRRRLRTTYQDVTEFDEKALVPVVNRLIDVLGIRNEFAQNIGLELEVVIHEVLAKLTQEMTERGLFNVSELISRDFTKDANDFRSQIITLRTQHNCNFTGLLVDINPDNIFSRKYLIIRIIKSQPELTVTFSQNIAITDQNYRFCCSIGMANVKNGLHAICYRYHNNHWYVLNDTQASQRSQDKIRSDVENIGYVFIYEKM